MFLRYAIALLLCFCGTVMQARAQDVDGWRISVLTFGPGPLIFERYGHVAIRLQNEAAGVDVSYDWGNFSFNDPNFLGRFVEGDLRYWMQGSRTQPMLAVYIGEWDRTVTEQTLNLTREQSIRLRSIIIAQDDEAHRFYGYDYFKDNCATRVRDVIDQTTGGALRAATSFQTAHSYRWHNRRLVPVGATNELLATLMDFAFGPRVDAPLTRWDECFLPGELADALDATRVTIDGQTVPLVRERRTLNATTRPANVEPTDAVDPFRWTLPAGIIGAVLLLALSRLWPLGFKIGATAWQLTVLIGAIFIPSIIIFTRHWVVAWNENLLQFTPLAVPILWTIWKRRKNVAANHTKETRPCDLDDSRGRSRRVLFWPILAFGLSVVGALVTISHLTPQRNAPAVCLALPLHAAVLAGIARLRLRHFGKGSLHAPIEIAGEPSPAR